MGVPRKRKSHSRTRMHRNNQGLTRLCLSACPRCGTSRKPHTICVECGFYREKTVINVEAETE